MRTATAQVALVLVGNATGVTLIVFAVYAWSRLGLHGLLAFCVAMGGSSMLTSVRAGGIRE